MPTAPKGAPEPDAHAELFHQALRVVAGDLLPAEDTPFDHPDSRVPGQIDKRVILQRQHWIDRLGHVIRLEDMSPGYRANVLAFLRAEAHNWIVDALAWEVTAAIVGLTGAGEASGHLELLDLLTTGWTDHTPLGQRLHQQNQPQAQPLPPPTVWVSAAQSDHPEVLRDRDSGCWQVSTKSGTTYLVDLDRRRIQRRPPPNAPTNGDSRPRALSNLPFDDEWTELDCLIWCRTGASLIALDQRPGSGGRGGYRISTAVVDITRVDTCPSDTGPETE